MISLAKHYDKRALVEELECWGFGVSDSKRAQFSVAVTTVVSITTKGLTLKPIREFGFDVALFVHLENHDGERLPNKVSTTGLEDIELPEGLYLVQVVIDITKRDVTIKFPGSSNRWFKIPKK